MKKIAGNRNYRLIKKADDSAGLRDALYQALRNFPGVTDADSVGDGTIAQGGNPFVIFTFLDSRWTMTLEKKDWGTPPETDG